MALDLNNMTQDQQFDAAAAYAGVPADFFRKMWAQESSNGTQMKSSAGALGHFQTMPKQIVEMSKRAGRQLDPMNFTDSLGMAAEMMKENIGRFGNLTDATKAYNAGWKPEKWNNPETIDYVQKLLGGDTASGERGFDVRNPDAAGLSVQDVWNTRAYDVRNSQDRLLSGTSPKVYLSDIEKAVQSEAGAAAAVTAQLEGGDAVSASLDARKLPTRPLVESYVDRVAAAPGMEFTTDKSWEDQRKAVVAAEERQKKLDSISFGDKFGAAFDQNTLTAGIIRFAEGGPRPAYDHNFDASSADNLKSIMDFANTEDEVKWQFEATSQADLERIRDDIKRDRYAASQFEGTSQWGQLGYSLLAGVADPAGWAAGLGVGKAFQLAGVGSNALFQAGRVGAGFVAAGAEGAIGNVLTSAVLDAAGQRQTAQDYAFATGMGLFMGASFGSVDYMMHRPAAAAQARAQITQLGQQVQNDAVGLDAIIMTEAQANLGPNATPAQIDAEIRRLDGERQNRVMQAVLANASEEEMILPKMDPAQAQAFRAQWQGAQTSTPQHMPGALLTNQRDMDAVIQRYGLHLTMEDGAERRLAAEMYARAERFLAANPVDKEHARSILAVGGLESSSARLLLSDNPILQMYASIALESGSGAQGGARRVTAAITAKSRERQYMGTTISEYEAAYRQYRATQNGSWMDDVWSQRVRRQFDRDVYAERDRRLNGHPSTTDTAVLRAADLLDAAYERMRVDQKFAGTLGSERLANDPVRGYSPRRWLASTFRRMNMRAMEAFQSEIARQFVALSNYDAPFAQRFAREYASIQRRRATGGYDIPATLHDPNAADVIRDALRALGATDMEMDSLMGRFSRGGASHTKNRIDLDLTASFTDSNGGSYSLLDYVDTDNMSLLRNYARRTASEVALQKYGIMGEPGLKEIRTAVEAGMGRGSDNPRFVKELEEAFDQTAAEFLGRPFGRNLGRWATDARVLTSAIRLGGMGFTQMAEVSNGIAAVGFMNALRTIPAVPRLIRAAWRNAEGQRTGSLLDSIELYTGELGVDGYRMVGLYDINDGFELYGQESMTVFSRAARLANHGVRVMSGHRAIAAAQTKGMAEQIVLKALRYIRDGGEDAALDDMGIAAPLRQALRRDLHNFATFRNGRVVELDLTKATDQIAANEFAQAVQRGSAQIIQETFIGETGKWAHDDFLKLLTQFRTFSLVSMEKQVKRQRAVHGDFAMLGYLMGAMSFAIPLHAARVYAKSLAMSGENREEYLERQFNPMAFGRATMNYVSILGVLPDLLDAPMALAGFEVGGRGATQSSFIGGSVAPAAGVINDAVSAAVSHDPVKAAKLVPGASIPHLSWLVNGLAEVEESFAE